MNETGILAEPDVFAPVQAVFDGPVPPAQRQQPDGVSGHRAQTGDTKVEGPLALLSEDRTSRDAAQQSGNEPAHDQGLCPGAPACWAAARADDLAASARTNLADRLTRLNRIQDARPTTH